MHPFRERQEDDEGGVKWGGIKQQRHEGRDWHERPDAVRIQAGAGDCIFAGTHIGHL